MTKELRELLTPPFRVIDYPEDTLSLLLEGVRSYPIQLTMSIMQEAIFTKAGCYEEFKDWIASALNEKWERDLISDRLMYDNSKSK